jgi:YVTN family beta-propeller protein
VAPFACRFRSALLSGAVVVTGVATSLLVLGCESSHAVGESARAANQLLAPNSVGVIDPATTSVVAQIRVGENPLDIVFAAGSVWVANVGDTTVTQIDPRTRRIVRMIDLGAAPMGLAADDGTVWVTNGLDGTLTRIDAVTGEVEKPVRLRPKLDIQFFKNVATHLEGAAWMPAVATQGSLWVSDVLSNSILRVDPAQETVADKLDGYDGLSLASGGEQLWVIDYQFRKLVRLDPGSNRPSLVVQLDPDVAPKALAADGESVWIANSGPSAGLPPNFIWRLDAATGAIIRKIDVGYLPDAIAVGEDAVWVANWGDRTVTKIDKATNNVLATLQVGRNVGGVAVAAGAVWITAQ